MSEKKILGILGGLGPMSSVYFYEMLTVHTNAACDQEHLNILISSRADTPDRTDFIIGRSDKSPLPSMINEVNRLSAAGADIVAIPCNTAHYFYCGVSAKTNVPLLNIIDETVDFCSFLGLKKVGVIATEGTVLSGAYSQKLTKNNIEFEVPSNDDQTVVNNIIYGSVKQGKEPDIDEFLRVADSLTSKGCEKIILGCTELSLLKRNCRLGIRFIDPLEVLAIRAISECGAASCGFDNELVKFSLEKGCK